MNPLSVPLDRFDNPEEVERRVSAAPPASQGSLRTTLRYLYEREGPVNLPVDRLNTAFDLLEPAEQVVACWLQTRTNGKLRKTYGANALRAARAAGYRCQECGFADVRVLNLDHVDGHVPGTPFACLCANCHTLKSRRVDWTGRARELRAPPEE